VAVEVAEAVLKALVALAAAVLVTELLVLV
jgi:hypothetical protein